MKNIANEQTKTTILTLPCQTSSSCIQSIFNSNGMFHDQFSCVPLPHPLGVLWNEPVKLPCQSRSRDYAPQFSPFDWRSRPCPGRPLLLSAHLKLFRLPMLTATLPLLSTPDDSFAAVRARRRCCQLFRGTSTSCYPPFACRGRHWASALSHRTSPCAALESGLSESVSALTASSWEQCTRSQLATVSMAARLCLYPA